MTTVVARRREGFTHDVEIEGGPDLVLDEPLSTGGNDEGPSPVRAVAAALAACTAITIEMYANAKKWSIGAVEVDVSYESDGRGGALGFDVALRLPAELDDEQRRRLLVIAGKCPVHRLLASETTVEIAETIGTLE